MEDRIITRVEALPFAADYLGIWLHGAADGTGPHWSAQMRPTDDAFTLLDELVADLRLGADQIRINHGTSCRVDHSTSVLTHALILDLGHDLVLDHWPDAHLAGPELFAALGPPMPHRAELPPFPRRGDVVFHALRHIAHLRKYDTPAYRALPRPWHRHLRRMRPTFYKMFKSPAPASDLEQHELEVARWTRRAA